MEKDFKIFTINYFCLYPVAFMFASLVLTLPGPWFGLVFSCSNWCWKWSFHFPEGSFPFREKEIKLRWAEPSSQFLWGWDGYFDSPPHPPGQGQASEGPVAGKKSWFISGQDTVGFDLPSPLESTKMQGSCPGIWQLANHGVFHKVDFLAQVVWKELNFVTKALWGFGGKRHLPYFAVYDMHPNFCVYYIWDYYTIIISMICNHYTHV